MQHIPDFLENNPELGIFDLEVSAELLDHEITIHPEVYLGRAEFDPPANPVERPLILRLVVRRDPEVFVSSLQRLAVRIGNKNPEPRGTRIVARSAVGVDDEFHEKYFVNE